MSVAVTGRMASVLAISPPHLPALEKPSRSSRTETSRRKRVRQSPNPKVNWSWFQRGIAEQNCALFEASLYPIKPELWSKTDQWLKKNHPIQAQHFDSLRIHLLVDDAIGIAFERSSQWSPERPISDWIMSYVDEAFSKFDPKLA